MQHAFIAYVLGIYHGPTLEYISSIRQDEGWTQIKFDSQKLSHIKPFRSKASYGMAIVRVSKIIVEVIYNMATL